MELTLENLEVSNKLEIKNNAIYSTYQLSGEFCSTNALYMKNIFLGVNSTQYLVVDLQQVTKTDLIAVNALAMAHRKHNLKVIMPKSEEAKHIFHLTKFNSILNLVEAHA